ncbi:MAG: hypothetical protein AB1Z23_02505 [Eubacteriales bacterium]
MMKMKMKLTKYYLVLVLSALFFAGCQQETPENVDYENTHSNDNEEYIIIGGEEIEKTEQELNLKSKGIDDISPLYGMHDLKTLDIRDNPIPQNEIIEFIKKTPDCQVLWSIYIGGKYYDSDIDEIDLSKSDDWNYAEASVVLEHFTELQKIQMKSTQISAEQYAKLREQYPRIEMKMSVLFCDRYYDADAKQLDLAECEEIDAEALAYFINIEKIDFGERILNDRMMDTVMKNCPDAQYVWNVELLDDVYSSTEEDINISYTAVKDFNTFKHRLKYLTSLKRINMTYCYLKNENMEELTQMYPHVKFVWRVRVGDWELSTDLKAFSTGKTEVFDGIRYFGDGVNLLDEDAAKLKYCTDLEALDIGHQMYITDYSFLQYMPKLKILIVAWTQLTDINQITHLKDLEYLEIFSNNIVDFSPLSQLTNLKYLNCSNNEMDSVDVFMQMPQLEKLWLVSCENISEEDRQRLVEALPDCEIVFDAQSPTHGGWRSRDNEIYRAMRETFGLRPVFYD